MIKGKFPPDFRSGTYCWLRRDLRLEDNTALFKALSELDNVIPIFIFDINILDKLDDKADRRVNFIYNSVKTLKEEVEKRGSSLLVLYGDPVAIFKELKPKTIYANHDYEPYGNHRDQAIKNMVAKHSGLFKTFKDQVIFEKNEVEKDDGKPYTVFTPYSKKWKSLLTPNHCKSHPEPDWIRLKTMKPLDLPSLESMGFKAVHQEFPPRVIRKAVISRYTEQRDFPAINGTSRLSVHLRFGTVSIRKLVQIAIQTNETWLNELIWREFYHMILWHFPQVVHSAFKPGYDRIQWRNDPNEFAAWCEGRTGFPMVDAGMRELNATGFMHNRTRMVVASFLSKHLLIDWRWGEAYFAEKLLDFDLAANNGGWQWAAGCGCDAAPYFRVFNPALQAARFDPDETYIRQWVPEVHTSAYPKPMVDHQLARDRAIATYQEALQNS